MLIFIPRVLSKIWDKFRTGGGWCYDYYRIMIIVTWCERLPSHSLDYTEYYAHKAYQGSLKAARISSISVSK